MIRKAFIINLMIITSSIFCEESIYQFSKFTPYVPDALIFENSSDNSLHYKISYNLMMHNYDDAIDNFNLLDSINNDEDKAYYIFFVLQILEIYSIREDRYSINKEFKRWKKVNDIWSHTLSKVSYAIAYDLYMELDLSYKKIEKRIHDTLQRTKKRISNPDLKNMLLLSKLIYERMDNDTLAITLIDKANPELYSFDPIIRKSKILAKNSIKDAINYLDYEVEKYYSDMDLLNYSVMRSYLVHLERAIMFLSYLHYKNNEVDKALVNFNLAISSKKHGSTFMNNWEYWLADRDYYEDEHEVMMKLKEMSLYQNLK